MKKGYLILILLIALSAINSCFQVQQKESGDKHLKSNYNFMEYTWQIDARPVLSRGQSGSFDSNVVGDPCIVWDNEINTWRMFYFAGGRDSLGSFSSTGMARSISAEEIGPGYWEKLGQIQFSNPEALLNKRRAHKFWVIMDPYEFNKAAKINNKYWAIS